MHTLRMTWSLAILVGLTGTAISDETARPKPTRDGAIKVWKDAGAEFGHFRFEPNGSGWWFVPEIQVQASDLPIFSFGNFKAETIAKLPVPSMPFGLYLSGLNMTEDGVKELSRFATLQAIRLDQTNVTDAALKHLAGLKELHTLDLSDTKITDAGIEHLAGLTKLHSLALNKTKVTDQAMKTLSTLKKLRILSLDATAVTEKGVKELAGLKLKQLTLPETAQTASCFKHYWAIIEPQPTMQLQMWALNDDCMKELRGVTGIETLHLASKHITDEGIKELATINGIQHLHLRGTSVTDQGLAPLAGMGLIWLSPPEQAQTDLGLKNYLAARRVWPILYLDEFKSLTDEGMKEVGKLKGLEFLHIGSDSKVTANGLAYLAGMNLKSLYPPHNARTDEGLKHYINAIAPTGKLSLSHWNITGTGLKEVTKIKGLRNLNLNHTKMTDAELQAISSMKDLRELFLSQTAITGNQMEVLRALENLETLTLRQTNVGDDAMKALGSMKNLKTLDLGETLLTDKGLENLTGLDSLETLRVYSTKVTAEGVKKLQIALPKCKIVAH